MVAIGRALMSRPKMILLDEPSMGLAPQLVEEIFEIVQRLNKEEGVTFLLAEQNTNIALEHRRQGILPRHQRRRARQLPRRQTLSPTQAMADLSHRSPRTE
jgi:branched-chain amino acid transport system ATP-binding protein